MIWPKYVTLFWDDCRDAWEVEACGTWQECKKAADEAASPHAIVVPVRGKVKYQVPK